MATEITTKEAIDDAWCDLVDETLISGAYVGDYDQLERWFENIPAEHRAEVLERLHAAAQELVESTEHAWRRWKTWQTHQSTDPSVIPEGATWLDAPPFQGPGLNA